LRRAVDVKAISQYVETALSKDVLPHFGFDKKTNFFFNEISIYFKIVFVSLAWLCRQA
tara:strand:- start:315 stop:488 length:174 start_codon:yes stop_codon:yes gene_type:complete